MDPHSLQPPTRWCQRGGRGTNGDNHLFFGNGDNHLTLLIWTFNLHVHCTDSFFCSIPVCGWIQSNTSPRSKRYGVIDGGIFLNFLKIQYLRKQKRNCQDVMSSVSLCLHITRSKQKKKQNKNGAYWSGDASTIVESHIHMLTEGMEEHEPDSGPECQYEWWCADDIN
jgi:hypothetical protein